MKWFPVTLGELAGLTAAGLAATFFFSLGSFFVSTAFDIHKDLAFTPGLTDAAAGYWRGLRDGAKWGAIGCFLVGVVLMAANGLTVFNICRNTEHQP